MSSLQNNAPGSWVDSDELADALSRLSTCRSMSTTMELDKSQPPTPDEPGLPANFAVIAPGIYRASYPQAAHFESMQLLELKTIVTLVPEKLPFTYANFITSNGILHHHIKILANKDPAVYTPDAVINEVLSVMLDRDNYPMLIHCNKGKHRTGCLSACFRKVTGWTVEACIDEYVKYSQPKSRDLDKAFITRYDASILKPLAMERNFVGGVYSQSHQRYSQSTQSSDYTKYTAGSVTSVDSTVCQQTSEERETEQKSHSDAQ